MGVSGKIGLIFANLFILFTFGYLGNLILEIAQESGDWKMYTASGLVFFSGITLIYSNLVTPLSK